MTRATDLHFRHPDEITDAVYAPGVSQKFHLQAYSFLDESFWKVFEF